MVEKEMEGMAGQIMAEQICLDTSVCIEIMKRSSYEKLSSFLTAEAFLSSITLFELMLTTHKLEETETFASTFEILKFDEKAARTASEIEKDLKGRGVLISREDIFIAATAMVNNCALATLNVKDFSRIKGLRLIKLHE